MKTLRQKSRLTQNQLGERVGVSQVYISKIERGDVKGLTIDKLVKLADALQVTPIELLVRLLNSKGE